MKFHFFSVVLPSVGPLCGIVASLAFIAPRRWPLAVKAAASLAVMTASLKFLWFSMLGGRMFQPELPATLIHAMSVVYDVSVLLGISGAFVLLFRAAAACVRRARRKAGARTEEAVPCAMPMPRRDFLAGCLAASTVPAAVSLVHEGVRLPRIRRVRLGFADLPEAFDGYRIVQISDIHVSAAARAERTEEVVRMVNSLKPDLIAVTGDIVDGTVAARRGDVEPLGALAAADGVFGCNGNHEYFRDSARWAAEFDRIGIRMLRNEAVEIKRARADGKGVDAVSVIGRNDPVSRDTDITAAASSGAPFKILLAHRPTCLAEHAALGIRLQLSGHTHGGAILGMDRFVARANEGHVRGIYEEDGIVLYVNSGTGQWAGFPERAGVPKEITEITLVRQIGKGGIV